MNPVERLAYLKGLIEGLSLDETRKETKVIFNLVELLEDIVFGLTKVEATVDELQEQVDAVDEDLGEIEKDLYDEDCDCCSSAAPVSPSVGNKKKKTQSELYYEVTCPTCNDTICLDDDTIANGEIDCPNCGEKLEFDLEG